MHNMPIYPRVGMVRVTADGRLARWNGKGWEL